jgi:ABC-2 type transport system permease protein
MSELTGTATLTRFALRRDRVRILVWIGAIVILVVSTAASVKGLYPTQADLDSAARAAEDNAAAIAFNGPPYGLDTVGGQVAFQVGAFGLIVIALMSVFTVGRLTRAEEEDGRTDLVLAMAVGRHAPTAAALIVAVGMNLVVGVLVTLGLMGQDLPTAGSVAFGLSFALLGLAFAGVATVAAQITENTRVVYGASGTVLGAAFVLRAAGDVGGGELSWLSPIGWAQKTRPYAGETWWPLLLLVALTALLAWGALVLANRRDIGAGLVPPRPGPATASPALGSPLGVALRLQRGSLIAWSFGILLTGVAYGSVGNDIQDLLGDNEALNDMIARAGGGDIVDSFLATSLLMLALMGSGFAIQSALRLRTEETAQRAEPILAAPVSRARWAVSHLVIALAGSVVVLLAAGLGTGVTYGIVAGDMGRVPGMVGGALAYVPAMWLLVGLAFAVFGLLPRAVLALWGVLGLCFVVGLLDEVLDLPAWVSDLSPFEHVPLLPAADMQAVPLLVLAAGAAVLGSVGFASFRHRDIG